ncbi:MAG: putative ATPase/DNA-binding winged helix-turn-helix (wHTH) protein [Kiritimatiellia bacterium]
MSVLPREPIQLLGGSVDLMRRLVHVDDRDTTLTGREVDLLHYLWRHSDRVVTREDLLVEVWGYSSDMVTRTVDNTVRRLRKKLERDARRPRHVLTEFGEGYRFAALRASGPDLPSGKIAIVGFRISGFVGLQARSSDVASSLLATFDGVVSACAGDLQGVVYRTGSECRVAFSVPRAAVMFAAKAQQVLFAASWHSDVMADASTHDNTLWRGPRVACAVVVGNSAPSHSADGTAAYDGAVSELCSLLADAANGGQILLGPTAWSVVAPAQGLQLGAVPVGAHRLRGRGAPVSLVSVVPESLSGRRFPPVRSLDVRQTNLPAESTSFVGRRRDLVAIRGYFARGAGLVTILGPAGAGKTRLSKRYGSQRTDALSSDGGGVWFCDLAACTDFDEVVIAVAASLQIPLDPSAAGSQDAHQVGRALAARGKLLLILDNVEQVVEGLALCVSEWRLSAARARILVTTRQPLGLTDEVVHVLGPLEAPEALALFVDRARAVRLDFQLAAEDVEAVAEIAVRLDFNPLAMELAAVRVKVLPPRSLAARLERQLSTLGSGPRDGSERHRTLRKAIDWSWAMLSDREREVLASVAIFRGGFTLDAALAVVGAQQSEASVQLMLVALRDKSLVRVFEPSAFPGMVRFALLESIREFALERGAEHIDAAEVGRKVAAWAVAAGERWLSDLDSGGGADAVNHLQLEVENLQVGFEASLSQRPELAVRLAVVLDAVLAPRGPYNGHMHILERAVQVGSTVDPTWQVPLLLACSRARAMRHDGVGAERDLHAAARIAGTDEGLACTVLVQIAKLKRGVGLFAEAARSLDSAAVLGAAPGDVSAGRCRLMAQAGRFEPALEASAEALDQLRSSGRRRAEGEMLVDAASWAASLGMVERARSLYRPALQVARQLGDLRLEGRVLLNLGELLSHQGRRAQALDHLLLALKLHRRVGDRRREGVCLGHLGVLRHLDGRSERAVRDLDLALTALDQADHTRGEGWFLLWRGTVMHEMGRLHDAVDATQRSLERLREIGDVRLEGRAATRTIPLLLELGRSSEAIHGATEAARLLQSCDDSIGLRALDVALAVLEGRRVPAVDDVLEVMIVRRLVGRLSEG